MNTSNENDLLHAILDRSTNEFFLMDADTFRFEFANAALLSNMGYSHEEFLSLSFEDTIAKHHQTMVDNMLNDFWQGREQQITFQKDTPRKDGSCYPVRIHMEYIEEAGRKLISAECFDLSHQKRQSAILEQQKKITRELRLSNKFKSNFFANLSHEMRTTLNTVLLLSKILSENKNLNLSEDQLNYAESIHNSTNSLLALLNEVLDMSKIESGKMSINLEYVDINDFCKELERLFQPVAREKGIRFLYQDQLKEELPFKTDHLRMEQVLKNLISNALKFTKEGFVQLTSYRPSKDEIASVFPEIPYPMVAFEVQDTGIGIPQDKLDRIFESYSQADDEETTREFGGTGLGLAISSEIVKILGGKIVVKSQEREGSTFTLYVPVDSSPAIIQYAREGKIKLSTAPSPTQEPSLQEIKAKQNGAGKIKGTVLLVDDNMNHNLALKEYLEFKVENCLTAQSAKEAYEMLNEQPVNCIILDMYLPDTDGKEVARKLRGEEKFKSLPIIIYSGKNLSQSEEEEMETIVDAIIQKNVLSYKTLLSKITGILHKANYEG
ncbi:PAS domain-containing hybrid sensor histidine kinase/response regulator [Gracilimonas mengyeensis]|uniref:histidine kinase n=1 Tax=Gracilimonas mengyeensis TaxID=1302730 RepID=A0A521D761_9BACT|nr:ATP-binding protein [Gracilimonas mengyeensis]SMO67543.1 PAS domain S-box-containing protein [Gracilimonas mengyeensis]